MRTPSSLPKLTLAVLATLAAASANLLADVWKIAEGPLQTKWAKDVKVAKVLPEYPRPQMIRTEWQNLNGLWSYGLNSQSSETEPLFANTILVPFVYESVISGIGKPSIPDQRLWYRRTFTIPENWKDQHVLLHFGAVNYHCTVKVNGKKIGEHTGGYDPFSFDITEHLKEGSNELIVSAWNPLKADVPEAQVLGKQRRKSEGIFYTAATGIWQTVWLEPVPAAYIGRLKITPDLDSNTLRISVETDRNLTAKIEVLAGEKQVASGSGQTNAEIKIKIDKPHLWSPQDPYLYNLKCSLLEDGKVVDSVSSYAGMRKISLGKDEKGRNRIFLNNKFVFQSGVLDQGYWPDGIYTAPTDEALRYDLEVTKKLGFNMSRKHAKVEPARWYYWADKLGILVWQDMPQMFVKDNKFADSAKQQFELEWRREMAAFHNYPSIVVWTTFNEGWGQHDTERVVALTKELDPSRLVNNASGWTDKKVGDMHDTHAYPAPNCELPSETRASVCGEFGGLGMRVDDHMWGKDAWGYQGVYARSFLLTRKYQQFQKTVRNLVEEKGMSAAVYTQITDVEQETNGLLTYDRAVIKPDLAITAAANQGKFLPLPPDPDPPLLATSADDPQIWRYTTSKPADDWMRSDFNDSSWQKDKAPFGHDLANVKTDWKTSDIWLRREVTLPKKLPKDMIFEIFHDEDVEIYINGVLAGTGKNFTTNYVNIDMNAEGRAATKPGKNVIAVHCRQTRGGQFIDLGIVEKK